MRRHHIYAHQEKNVCIGISLQPEPLDFSGQALTIKEFGKQIFPESISRGLHAGCGVVTIISINRISRASVVLFVLKTLKILDRSIPSSL